MVNASRRDAADLHNPIPRRFALSVTAVLAVLAVLAAIALSPLALLAFKRTNGVDWTRLSEIGQTYGAASAVVSALALGGVALSLFLQTRQSRAEQVQAIRGIHTELVRMELEDLPLYLPCWGPLNIPTEE